MFECQVWSVCSTSAIIMSYDSCTCNIHQSVIDEILRLMPAASFAKLQYGLPGNITSIVMSAFLHAYLRHLGVCVMSISVANSKPFATAGETFVWEDLQWRFVAKSVNCPRANCLPTFAPETLEAQFNYVQQVDILIIKENHSGHDAAYAAQLGCKSYP